MSVNAILEALGAKDESDALRISAETTLFLADLKSATGEDTFPDMLKLVKLAVSLKRDVENVTGKGASEAIGVVLAWKNDAAQLPELNEKVTKLESDAKTEKVKQLLACGLQKPGPGAHKFAGKLTPAMAKKYEELKLEPEQIEAMLETAARVIPTEHKQEKVETKGTGSVAVEANGSPATAEGKRYEDMKPAARSKLKKEDPELFEVLRSDWVGRGSPAST